MRTATVYFSCGERCVLSFTETIRFTTLRGAKVAFRNAVHRNFDNAAALYGNFAHCKAEVIENGKAILTATFVAGYFA